MRTLFRTVPLRTASFIVAGLMSACGPTPTENIVFRIELIAGPNLIKNGSFEDDREAKFVTRQDEPIVPAGGVGGVPFKELCGNSNSLTNWEVTRIGAKQQDCTPAQTGGAFVAMSWFDVQNNSIGITAPDGRMAVNCSVSHDPPQSWEALRKQSRRHRVTTTRYRSGSGARTSSTPGKIAFRSTS
jgi:hypothetical protein